MEQLAECRAEHAHMRRVLHADEHLHSRYTTRFSSLFIKWHRARIAIMNWRFLSLNSWQDCVISHIVRHASNLDYWFTRKMLDLLILKLMFSFLNCLCYLPIIIYTKPVTWNKRPVVVQSNIKCDRTSLWYSWQFVGTVIRLHCHNTLDMLGSVV